MVVKELERVSRGLRSLLFMVKAAILDDGVVRGVRLFCNLGQLDIPCYELVKLNSGMCEQEGFFMIWSRQEEGFSVGFLTWPTWYQLE